jgi:hypothetical protein
MISFKCGHEAESRSDFLRGYFGKRFEDKVLLHHHAGGDEYVYRYPLVQYKILDGKSMVLGIGMGADTLKGICKDVNMIDVNGKQYEIFEKTISMGNTDFGVDFKQITYSFLTPWLALNERNYEKYQMLGTWAKKKELLQKILIGNIISMSKSLGYTVPAPIVANIHHLKEVKTSLKGTPMLGFLGTFSVNFEIPDYWGIGKSVSRGFGTIIRV